MHLRGNQYELLLGKRITAVVQRIWRIRHNRKPSFIRELFALRRNSYSEVTNTT
ncbi:hypothetical protein [Blastopirellula marina]|uniref:Uncharacterized protein n=1 Tax=Blastopirellula marina DSM 3645 TaxID=314230 RepID=A3ZT28_9BACT|nr:hypothetical protein [Blastopirellula marina]EAQ80456.1 hypothetical protein DSM3645_11442 [Blastopirellula marina DSM 3645]